MRVLFTSLNQESSGTVCARDWMVAVVAMMTNVPECLCDHPRRLIEEMDRLSEEEVEIDIALQESVHANLPLIGRTQNRPRLIASRVRPHYLPFLSSRVPPPATTPSAPAMHADTTPWPSRCPPASRRTKSASSAKWSR